MFVYFLLYVFLLFSFCACPSVYLDLITILMLLAVLFYLCNMYVLFICII